jgi:hypothetical protein
MVMGRLLVHELQLMLAGTSFPEKCPPINREEEQKKPAGGRSPLLF